MPPTIRYRVPLTCPNCGFLNDSRAVDLHSSGLGNDPVDTSAVPGQALEVELVDFEDSFLTLRAPREAEDVFVAIEFWGCASCDRLSAARLVFRRRTRQIIELVSVTPASLPTGVLEEAHFISRRLVEYAPRPGDDAEMLAELERRLS